MKKIRGAQSLVLAELAARKVRVAATSQILVNAVFVHVTPKDAAALKNIPGVKWVQYQPPSKPALNAAVDLVRRARGMERDRRERQRRRGREDRHHRYRHRPEPPRV